MEPVEPATVDDDNDDAFGERSAVVYGRVSGKVALRWGGDRTAVEGRAAVDGLDLAGPWLGADRVRTAAGRVAVQAATLAGGELRVESARLTCDVGTASVAGVFNPDEPVEKLLARPGLRVDADVDAARLAAILPRLLRVKDGTELREGRVAVHLESKPAAEGTTWDGTVRTTALRGIRAASRSPGTSRSTCLVRRPARPDGVPASITRRAQSDFVAVAARGSPDQFLLMANLNLDRLAARLGEFVDLGGLRFGGHGRAHRPDRDPRPGGGFTAAVTGRLEPFTSPDRTAGGSASRSRSTCPARAEREASIGRTGPARRRRDRH